MAQVHNPRMTLRGVGEVFSEEPEGKAARDSRLFDEVEQLVARLLNLPARIRVLELEEETWRARSKEADAGLDLRSAELAATVTGATVDERKALLVIMKAADTDYADRLLALRQSEHCKALAAIDAEQLRREFQAVRTVIELRTVQVHVVS